MDNKMETQELLFDLHQFNGTENYYRTSALDKRYFHTDGIQYLADNARCDWLLAIVTSCYHILKDCDFQVWTVNKNGDGVTVTCEDGNENQVYRQEIEYSDFPLDTFSFYCEVGSLNGRDLNFIIMLKNER
jgi:hypothetical protein